MELVAGVWVDGRGTDNLGFYVMATVEENLEMLGAFGLVLALLTFVRTVTLCAPVRGPSRARLGHRVREPAQRLQVLERRRLDGADAAELLHQPLLAGLAEAGDAVEHRRRHPLAPQLAVVRDGEAVGLVADALQQVQRLGLARDADRARRRRARTPPRSAWRGRRPGSRR